MSRGTAPVVRAETLHDGRMERLVLSRPKANVLDAEMVALLRDHLAALAERPELQLVVFEGEGEHFSFGASVEEHLPERVAGMLQGFHALFRDLEALGVPTAAVVRGQCLGGGLELAASCGMVFCTPSARMGLPEVQLGVFPPVGALLLPWRVGGARATQLVVTGEPIGGEEAARIGLADVCGVDVEERMQGWWETHLSKKSAVAVRYAWKAARAPVRRLLEGELGGLERLYLDELMRRGDPVEGLQAFLGKRAPVWGNR